MVMKLTSNYRGMSLLPTTYKTHPVLYEG